MHAAAATARSTATTAARSGSCGAATSRVGDLVAHAVDSEHITRPARIALELAADVLDVCVDSALERVHLDSPHRIEQLCAREDASRVPRHRRQQLEFGRCE